MLFLFLDGVGLGSNDPSRNPFCLAHMPVLEGLLGPGWYLGGGTGRTGTEASLAVADACLGVPGRPQSATGQAALLTGRNVPREIGEHYGPKPTPEIAALLTNGNLFSRVRQQDGIASLLNPYPPSFFEAIGSGRRLLPAVALAASSAGLTLYGAQDLRDGRAVSPDFTGDGWRRRLGYSDMPVLTLAQAGQRLARLGQEHTLAFFEHWPTDLVGHRQDWPQAVELLERFDAVVGALLCDWSLERNLVVITSDHGNIEDLSTRAHTDNPVPAIFIGAEHARLAGNVRNLADVAPAILGFLGQAEQVAHHE